MFGIIGRYRDCFMCISHMGLFLTRLPPCRPYLKSSHPPVNLLKIACLNTLIVLNPRRRWSAVLSCWTLWDSPCRTRPDFIVISITSVIHLRRRHRILFLYIAVEFLVCLTINYFTATIIMVTYRFCYILISWSLHILWIFLCLPPTILCEESIYCLSCLSSPDKIKFNKILSTNFISTNGFKNTQKIVLQFSIGFCWYTFRALKSLQGEFGIRIRIDFARIRIYKIRKQPIIYNTLS